jgi:hypothetical protein
MKLDRQGPAQGSFGIPPQMAEAAAKQRETRAAEKPAPIPEAAEAALTTEPEEQKKSTTSDPTPTEMLSQIGAKFTDDDFQRLLFKGYYEAELEVFKGKFKATFRTLTGREYDEVDEMLAEDIKDVAMTNDGLDARRAMWIISYGVTHLMGKPVAKVIMTKDKLVDSKETARARRQVLAELAPQVTNKLLRMHGTIVVSLNQIAADPEQFLKNS